jgi:hypothetical protein
MSVCSDCNGAADDLCPHTTEDCEGQLWVAYFWGRTATAVGAHTVLITDVGSPFKCPQKKLRETLKSRR